MKIGIRLDCDRYILIDINVSERILTFLDAVPNCERTELQDLADEYCYTITLPLTNEVITPKERIPNYNAEALEDYSTLDKLTLLVAISDYFVTED